MIFDIIFNDRKKHKVSNKKFKVNLFIKAT